MLSLVGVRLNSFIPKHMSHSEDLGFADTSVALSQAIAFFVGYFLQDIVLALKLGLAGTVVTFLVVVPPWPFFNRNPVKWLPVGGGAAAAHQNIVVDEKMFAH